MHDDSQNYVTGYIKRAPSSSTDLGRVTVKDPTSPHNQQSFVIGSVRGKKVGDMVQGLNVSFFLGQRDDKADNPKGVALDVHPVPLGESSNLH